VTLFRAVLFDRRGTLAAPLGEKEWIERGLAAAGRSPSPEVVTAVQAALGRADAGRRLLAPGMDADPARHRAVFAEDALPCLARLSAASVRTAVVGDVHVDIRPAFARAGPAG